MRTRIEAFGDVQEPEISISDDTVTLVLKNGEIKIKTSFINSIS